MTDNRFNNKNRYNLKKNTFSRERLTLDKCEIRKKLYFTFVLCDNCARNYKSIFFSAKIMKSPKKAKLKTIRKNRRIIAMAFA